MKCYVQTGKIGDILSALPIVYHEFKVTKQKPALVVAAQFGSIYDAISYVIPKPWNGHWQDLKGCLAWAKSFGDEVICTQIYGKSFPFQRRTSSFQMDAWERTGCLLGFGIWPLVIDRRNRLREKQLMQKHVTDKPYILLADHSESSPWQHIETLAALLKSEFGETHQIIRLSTVHAENFIDLLGLYDKADALVTIDTAHVHLSAASTVPVFAFVTDTPSRWHGTASLPRFSFHCRYSDFEERREEFVESLRQCMQSPTYCLAVPAT